MPAATCGHTRHAPGCPGCRGHGAAYYRSRGRQIAAGTWQPLAPAAPVLAHIAQLRAGGMLIWQIAEAAGLPTATVQSIIRQGRTVIRGRAAAALLAVAATPWPAPQGNLVPVLGPARRTRALVTAGYTQADQGQRAGLDVQLLRAWAAERHPYATAEKARAMGLLFDGLEFTPGPSQRARAMGRRRGWPLPLAWDEDTIDDPEAQPFSLDEDVDVVDEVAIGRVLAGKAAAADLTPANQAALYHQLHQVQGLTHGQVRYRLGLSTWQTKRLARTWQQQQQTGQLAAAS